eukprot:CAMPEP_0195302094 /NCGR_PEP_ID=MMETSP0707-20130614/30466_1 /TAXON_ID=33640 /ORGANISM="Asterionellopsis glacialis, Strain CCMP134" /LENGTH=668 /DNA_ID=CAMNT_0040365247 /DNA_START=215 /DNA_END=2218 /DNA_ORIENTATION=-
MRQESHRVYWHQWGRQLPADGGFETGNRTVQTPRQLITSSANIRISEAARAQDVTQLLRKTLNFAELQQQQQQNLKKKASVPQDSLVLVGTIRHRSVQFEHEPPPSPPHMPPQPSSPVERHELSPLATEPIHVIRSLQGGDSPLVIRDKLLEYICERYDGNSKIRGSTAQLQWFFVPGSEPSGNIPNFINLDGYCTDMDDDDEDNENYKDDDESDYGCDYGGEIDDCEDEWGTTAQHLEELPWKKTSFQPSCVSPSKTITCTTLDSSLPQPQTQFPLHKNRLFNMERKEKIYARERRKLMQLNQSRAVVGFNCISGYLLKRSSRDKHVWKRVHCTLTDDYLWFVSRYYEHDTTSFHKRIGLAQALLVEPNSSTSSTEPASMFRVPFCFELIASNGVSHVFRSVNAALQRKWIAHLSERIVQCHDNKLMAQAELIVGDETVARNKRLAKVALPQSILGGVSDGNVPRKVTLVMRFGMAVAEYRERCRHIQAILPGKSHVVLAMSTSNSSERLHHNALSSPSKSNTSFDDDLSQPEVAPFDPETLDMVRAAWDVAISLLTGTTMVAFSIPGASLSSHDGSRRMVRSLETICRHIEYVITGHLRPISDSSVFSVGQSLRADLCQDDPPPMDLFDTLLLELQSLTAVSHAGGSQSITTTGVHLNGTHTNGEW